MIGRSFRLALVVFFTTTALAAEPQGFAPRPTQTVRLTNLVAQVSIVDGVASTNLRQTWRNDGDVEAEATWILPLPAGAAADGFTLTIGGVPTAGEVLDAGHARETFERIVRSRRDPGLLEYFGRGCLRARIFPIPAHGESIVEVGFRALLPEALGLRKWSLALGAAGNEGLAPERVVLDLALSSKKALKNAYTPLAAVQVIQKSDHEVRASFEGSGVQLIGQELALYYGLSEAEFGLDFLAHRPARAEEGTFLMLLSPKRDWQAREELAKSIVFVLDTSGSMEGKKIAQAKNALRLFLYSLASSDTFNVVPFATEAEPFFAECVPASEVLLGQARERIERITAAGGTNIHGALSVALSGLGQAVGAERVPMVVFLTDGEPTVGETKPEVILRDVLARNAPRARLFVFGVGNTVNTLLLDSLAAQNGGARDYVREEERIDEKTHALFAKLAHPVMTDLALTIDGLTPTKCVPAVLPDLFAGDRIELFGRYAGEGANAIRLSGLVGGVRREYVYEASFARETTVETAFLAPLWAERRVGVLLDQIRLNGPNAELVGEVERLGREYRIVTPYTSHLVLEPGMQRFARGGGGAGPSSPGGGAPGAPGAGGGKPMTGGGSDGFFLGKSVRREPDLDELAVELGRQGVLPADATREELVSLATLVVHELRQSEVALDDLGRQASGDKAIDDSQYLADLMRGRVGAPPGALFDLFSRRVRDRNFVLRAGVCVEVGVLQPLPETRRMVEAFSAEYFALLTNHPELAPYLALSPRLVMRVGSEIYEISTP